MNGEKTRIASISSPKNSIAERIAAGRREDVDEAAADGELAALLDAVDALVAREGQPLRERVEARSGAAVEHDRLRPRLGRRQRLRNRSRGDADEPARREHVERPGPFAHEVRRRLEPRPEPDTAARKQRDPLLTEEPAAGLGRVTRVGVLGNQARREPRPSCACSAASTQWKRGLGDARSRGQRCGVGRKPLVREQLLDERMQHRACGLGQVHDERRNPRFRAPIVALS